MQKSITILLVGVSFILSCSYQKINDPLPSASKSKESNEIIDSTLSDWTYIDFKENNIKDSLVYATSNNFLNKKIYPCPKCYLRPEAADALKLANKLAYDKNLMLVLFDCYRPVSFQKEMYDLVKNPKYVAEPKKGGSMHNKGLAVDIALADSTGHILDFGGNFDDFTEISHHSYSDISSLAKANRKILKGIMTEAGFSSYENEWWHYSYKKIDYEADNFIWNCDQ